MSTGDDAPIRASRTRHVHSAVPNGFEAFSVPSPEGPGRTGALLRAVDLCVGYHEHAVVERLELSVQAGEVVTLLGANGAGKTTTLLALSGDLPALSGEIWFDGKLTRDPLYRRARHGLALVTEDRSVFMSLSVRDNLRVGRCDIEFALDLFPELRPLLKRRVSFLSGGEQQMVSLGRALARRPKLLLVDEVSLGLAPLVVERLMRAIRSAADSGVGVLLVEQQVRHALYVADFVYVMSRGKVVLKGTPAEVSGRLEDVEASYWN